MTWIAGLTGTALAGKYVWSVDLGYYQYETTDTAVASPQAAAGLDPEYPSSMSLVSPQTNPGVDFSAYPAQDACKAMGGRLPNMQELLAIYAGKASYGNNFQTYNYWSATEYDRYGAQSVTVGSGSSNTDDKASNYNFVRPVKDSIATAPTVTDSAATSITTTTATGNGNVTSDGGASVSVRGVCWGASANPTTAGSHATASGTTGAFEAHMTSLTPGALIYWRMYATNSVGTTYSTGGSFTTNALFIPRIICC